MVTAYRNMTVFDLFRMNMVNLDAMTENFHVNFYTQYLATWPDLCVVAESPEGLVEGYIIGKVESVQGIPWHGHVTALSIAPDFRRMGLAQLLMDKLEEVSFDTHSGRFVDLYVRVSNVAAVTFYERRGYSTHERCENYYSSSTNVDGNLMEDALDEEVPKRLWATSGSCQVDVHV
eukprot:GHVU01065770.1.p1 GENE.GHVU01065770.1~~GHVU01065770.1.p1  ORF type:complete len:206 (-),score=10.23 GHVU01065770.1:316-843(-)